MYGSPPNAREGSWGSLMHRPIHPPIDVDCAIRFPNTNSFSLCSPWYNPEYETQNDLRDQSDARLTTGLGLSETPHQTHQTKLIINHLTVISVKIQKMYRDGQGIWTIWWEKGRIEDFWVWEYVLRRTEDGGSVACNQFEMIGWTFGSSSIPRYLHSRLLVHLSNTVLRKRSFVGRRSPLEQYVRRKICATVWTAL